MLKIPTLIFISMFATVYTELARHQSFRITSASRFQPNTNQLLAQISSVRRLTSKTLITQVLLPLQSQCKFGILQVKNDTNRWVLPFTVAQRHASLFTTWHLLKHLSIYPRGDRTSLRRQCHKVMLINFHFSCLETKRTKKLIDKWVNILQKIGAKRMEICPSKRLQP